MIAGVGATGLRPFVPARDFAVSRRFYEAIGFAAGYADDSIAILTLGQASFILQNYYVAELADNFMLQLLVDDVDAWWAAARPDRLVETFGIRPPTAPKVQPWGLKVGFLIDPAGVLWHVTEAAK